MGLSFNSPENFEESAKVAYAMYEHVARAGLGGLPFADVAAAIAMVNGMFLAGAYKDRAQQEIAARNMANVAVEHARRLKNAERVPYDSLAAGSKPQA